MNPSIPILIAGSENRHNGRSAFKPYYVYSIDKSDLKDFLNGKRKVVFEKKYGKVSELERQKLFFLMRLVPAIRQRNERTINKAIETYLSSFIVINDAENAYYFNDQVENWLRDIMRNPVNKLHREVNTWLQNVRFIIWSPKGAKMATIGLYCNDIITALFAVWISRITQAKGISICLRCDNPFERSRQNQQYCSYYCQNAAAVARSRKKKRDVKQT